MASSCADCTLLDIHDVVFLCYLVLYHLWAIRHLRYSVPPLLRSGRKRNKLQHRELLEAIRDGKMNKIAE